MASFTFLITRTTSCVVGIVPALPSSSPVPATCARLIRKHSAMAGMDLVLAGCESTKAEFVPPQPFTFYRSLSAYRYRDSWRSGWRQLSWPVDDNYLGR